MKHLSNNSYWKDSRKLSPIFSEEESLLSNMLEDSYSVIEDIQSYLDKRNSLPKYVSKERIFTELSHILMSKKAKPEKKLEALQLIDVLETKIKSESEINSVYVILIPAVLSQIGSFSPGAQKASIDILQRVTERRGQILLDQLATNGIDNTDDDISIESLKLVPGIFYKKIMSKNHGGESIDILPVLEKSFKQLIIKNRQVHAFGALNRLRELLGEERFDKMAMHGVPEKLRTLFYRLNRSFDDQSHYGTRRRKKARDSFGIIPAHITNSLYNPYNRNIRAEGIEKLREYLEDVSTEEWSLIFPYMDSFLRFLGSLLDDINIKVVKTSLEIQQMLLYDKRTVDEVRNHFHILIQNLLKIRPQSIPRINVELYQFLKSMLASIGPGLVVSSLSNELDHRNASKREALLNYITFGLLTFPSSEFDLLDLISPVLCCVNDSKRRVRQAALECISVISQALGPQKSKIIFMKVSDLFENRINSEKIIDALQCRFSRKILPKILEDGSIEYGLQIPRQMYDRRLVIRNKFTNDPDIDWIIEGKGNLRWNSLNLIPPSNVHRHPKKSLAGIKKSSSTNSLESEISKLRKPRIKMSKKKSTTQRRSLSENSDQPQRQLVHQSLSSREER